MKALVKRYAKPGIWMEDVPMPEVGVNDVLIKVKKAAICGTDLHMYKWDAWSQAHCTPPYTMGHEFVGEVAEIGPGVRNIKVGERVTAEGHIVCGHCRNCRRGMGHVCENTISVGIMGKDGCFAEYVTIPESNVVKLHPTILQPSWIRSATLRTPHSPSRYWVKMYSSPEPDSSEQWPQVFAVTPAPNI